MKAILSFVSPGFSPKSRNIPYSEGEIGICWPVVGVEGGKLGDSGLGDLLNPLQGWLLISKYFTQETQRGGPKGNTRGGWGWGRQHGGGCAPGSLQRGATAPLSGQCRLQHCNMSADRAGARPHNQRARALLGLFPSASAYFRDPLGRFRWRKRGNGDRILETLASNQLFWKLPEWLNMLLTS